LLRNGLRLCLFFIGFALVSCDFTPYEDYYNQAIDHTRKGDYKEALYYIDKSIRQNPNITDSYFLRAECKIELDDWEGALLDYQEIIILNPQNTLALYAAAALNGHLENYKLAILLYTKALNTPGAIDFGTQLESFTITANLDYNLDEQMYKVEIQFSRGQAHWLCCPFGNS